MGSHVAPAYANAYMNELEVKYIFNNSLFLQYAKCYHRYIDDIFCVWSGSLDSLKTFHEYLNSIIPELSFTIQYNMKEIPFLDTLVLRTGGTHQSQTERDAGIDVPAEQTPPRLEKNGRPQRRRIEIPPVQQRKLDS
ncbi:unnamed protein product [Ranitomeya imitator]|uniref:Reverse transcriptase domain-containing protein n=1 Tax=Ranitomeya imitator TaxID=111125 RepID=A0ABN9KMC2_9NEOB|nr:unnamed protein product [Ranitomeya imitator]